MESVKQSSSPKVSAVVISYRGGRMLEQCIGALENQDYLNLEIVIVDNGSGMDLATRYADTFKRCRCITEDDNKGFAGGCNRGISQAKGDLIALVNDDAMVSPTWVSEMVKTIMADPSTGAVAGLVVDGNNPAILDSCGVGVALDGMSRQLECGAPSNAERSSAQVLAFSGCSCMIRKEALDETGLFDERFFAYCEDTDLSLRILQAGWQIVTCPSAASRHYYSHTGGRFSLKKLYLIERNHHWVAVRNFPFALVLLLPLINVWRGIVQFYALLQPGSPVKGFISNGPHRVAFTLLRAQLSACLLLPGMLVRRIYSYSRSKKGLIARLFRERMTLWEVFRPHSATATPKDQTH